MSVELADETLVREAARETRLFIAGEWREGAAGRLDVVNPATEERVSRVALAASTDVHDAVAAAHSAFLPWAATPAHERGAVLIRASALLKSRGAAIIRALMQEAGKTRADAVA